MTAATTTLGPELATRRLGRSSTLTRSSGVVLGLTLVWFSALVFLPLCLVVVRAAGLGLGGFLDVLTGAQTMAALRLTVQSALVVTLINSILGTLIAWVLVRDSFPGKRVLEVIIDIPFALPTIVAGLVLLSLYGPDSPLGLELANTKWAVSLALLFVTLPFVVRTVQPVLMELDTEVEEAAASLGASPFVTFVRVILPGIAPAIAAGAAMSFARGISEYGSLVLLSGNLPMRTEVASVRILTFIENGDESGAAVIASLLLVVALVVIVVLDLVSRAVTRRG